jgi:hypothetical protein
MIKQYVYEAVQGHKADGFLQRFQLSVFVEAVEQKLIDRYPNKQLRDDFHNMIEAIATIEDFDGTEKDDFENIPFYRFEDKAQIVFNEWYINNSIEAQNAFNEAYEGHLSKYPKLFASLCLIFYICDIVDYGYGLNNYNIDKQTALRVVNLIEVFKAHAEKLYSTYEIEEAKKDQMTDNILEFLATQDLPIKYRDVTLKVKGKPIKAIIQKAISGAYKDCGSKIVSKIHR